MPNDNLPPSIEEPEDQTPQTGAPNGLSPDKPVQLNFNQIVDNVVLGPLSVTCRGLFATFQGLPPEVMVMAIATAFGKIMSEGTASTVPAVTLKLRNDVLQTFTKQLRSHTPAIGKAPAGGLILK
jgi:hypothetical protein